MLRSKTASTQRALLPELPVPAARMAGMGGHQSSRMERDEWLTPPFVLKALGRFDLDPCAPIKRPWEIARRHLTILDNGLLSSWQGRVFCNPPYGTDIGKWMARMAGHGDGIALTFARTETQWFHEYIWPHAQALFFFNGRLTFFCVDGKPGPDNGGAPSVLTAYGKANAECLRTCGLQGAFVEIRP